MERLFLGIYWKNRQESIRTVAEKLYSLMHRLVEIDNRLQNLKIVTLAKIENKLFDFSQKEGDVVPALANAILADKQKQIRKYHPSTTPSVDFHEPVGFVLAFDVPGLKKMDISGILGSYDINATNNFLIKFPPDFLYDFKYVDSLFTEVVNVLRPNWGVISSRRFDDELLKYTLPEIRPGWLNYFSNNLNVSELKEKMNSKDVQDGFITYATSGDEIFSTDNKQHVEKVFAVRDFLRKKKITSHSGQ